MNLVIDQGNTSVKVGVFRQEQLVEVLRYPAFGNSELEALLKRYAVKQAIVSAVGREAQLPLCELERRVPRFVKLTSQTRIPLQNLYGTPETLGADRLAACVGAAHLLPGRNLLVVDMGTCITLDVVTCQGQFLGGNISPGMHMRFKALHQFTAALPQVQPQEEVPLYGKDTQHAIMAGVVQAITFELEGYMRELQAHFPNLALYLTGGDAFYFEKRLKFGIFVNPNLLLIGLNRILQFNA